MAKNKVFGTPDQVTGPGATAVKRQAIRLAHDIEWLATDCLEAHREVAELKKHLAKLEKEVRELSRAAGIGLDGKSPEG